jgi:hypothetical protein
VLGLRKEGRVKESQAQYDARKEREWQEFQEQMQWQCNCKARYRIFSLVSKG